MRIAIAFVLLLVSVISVSAQSAAPAAGAAGPLQSVDVPMTGKPQTVAIAKRVFRPGESSGFHTHDGVEIAQVVSGSIQIVERGGASKTYNGGESFVVPRGVVHYASIPGTIDTQLAITYLLDKGAPLRVMAPQ